MMSDQTCLTVLLAANNGLDNMASLQAVADELRTRGHRVVFTADISHNGLITSYKDVTDYDCLSSADPDYNNNPLDLSLFDMSPVELFEQHDLERLRLKMTRLAKVDFYYTKLVERVRPDVIVVESELCTPALTNSGIPWLWLHFGNPCQVISDSRLPPALSGLSLKSSPERWFEFTDRKNHLLVPLREELNRFCLSRGAPMMSKNQLHPTSPHLNVYVYPRELDIGKSLPPSNWVKLDSLMKDIGCPLELPTDFVARPGKLVYLALDMYRRFEDQLLARLIPILAESDNKFIAAKELFPVGYQLPDNILSVDILSVTDAIRTSDLVMTSGDLKTVTEALYYGKPIIALPLFGSQLDNAVRLKDAGLAVTLMVDKCQVSTTYGSINAMLEDPLVRRALANTSHRLRTSDDLQRLCTLIEDLVRPKKPPPDENDNLHDN